VDPARRIRISGWGAADDFPYVAQNEALWRSPGMARATAGALARAGTGVDELALFDLYSCFPAALRFAADALGVGLDDPRGLTVTGGMAAAGGPGSGYVTHALAQMTASLRDRPGASGLVTGLSAQMAAHTATVLTSGPAGPPRAGRGGGGAGVRPVALADVASGPGSLEAYAVACDREGHDEVAVAVCRLADRRRCYAVTRDPGLLELLVKAELVGTPVVLNRVRGENRFAAP